MTVNSTVNRSSYAGNGVTTAFSTVFPFLSSSDLVVLERNNTTGVETVKTLTTHYTVSGGSGSSGTVTMLTAPATGVTLVIYRDPPLTQLVDVVDNDPLPAATIEQPLDKGMMAQQRTREIAERSLRLPDGDTGFTAADMKLPSKVTRAGMLLAFDVDGKPMASAGTGGAPTSAFMATVLDDTTAAAARSTLGAGAATDVATLITGLATEITDRAAADTAIRSDLASTSDANKGDKLIGVKRTETGAVAYTQHDYHQTRAVYAQRDFGVPADGVTDSTSALTSMFASEGRPYILEPGTYLINSPLTCSNNLTGLGSLYTHGVIIKFTGTGQLIVGDNDVEWQNIWFQSAVNNLTFIKCALIGFNLRKFRMSALSGATGQTGIEFDTNVFGASGTARNFVEKFQMSSIPTPIKITGSGYCNGNRFGTHGDIWSGPTSGIDIQSSGVFSANDIGGYFELGTNCVKVGASATYQFNRFDGHLDNMTNLLNTAANISSPNWWKVLPADWLTAGAGTITNQILEHFPGAQTLQGFTLQLENVAGTIKHAITCDAAGGASNFVGKVTGASTTQAATPTGADGSTAFASGGKISSAATNSFVFDTAAQTLANELQIATILVNSTTTDLTVEPIFTSRDVNGTTRRRLEFLFRNATTGAAFDLTTLASGKLLYVRYLGYLA